MTSKQSKCLDFITNFINKNGFSPSYDEIGEGIGVQSKSAVHGYVKRLVRDGHIYYKPRQARGITLVEKINQQDKWVRLGTAAQNLLASIKQENIDGDGEGTVLVDAALLGDLDIAVAEASPERTEKKS